jgi:hypothetical protein
MLDCGHRRGMRARWLGLVDVAIAATPGCGCRYQTGGDGKVEGRMQAGSLARLWT